jgi:MFS family permease
MEIASAGPTDQAYENLYPSQGAARYAVVVLFLGFVMAYLDRQVIGLLIPSLKAGIGLSDTQVSLIQGIAFSAVFAFAGIPIGRCIDRANRRNIIVGGLVVWTLATILSGFASSFGQLFAARMVVGIGEACVAPATVSLLSDYVPPARRGRAIGLAQIGTPVGTMSSLILGGMLLSALQRGHSLAHWLPSGWRPWQVVFVAFGAPGLLVATLACFLREPPRRSLPSAGTGATSGPGLLALLRARPATFAVFYGLFGCMGVMGYGLSSWGPTVLMRIYHLSPRTTGGLYGVAISGSAVLGAALSGFFSDYLARRRPQDGRSLMPLLLLPLEILALFCFWRTHSLPVLIPIMGLCNFGVTTIGSSAYAALQEFVPNALRGQAVALHLLFLNLLGQGLAPTLIALMTDKVFHDEMRLQDSVAGVCLAAGLAALVLAALLPKLFREAKAASPAS